MFFMAAMYGESTAGNQLIMGGFIAFGMIVAAIVNNRENS